MVERYCWFLFDTKNLLMCNRVVDNQAHALENSNECCKTQEMCDEAVDT